MATVTDDPLSKKVEMTNWEKVYLHCTALLGCKVHAKSHTRVTISTISMARPLSVDMELAVKCTS